MKRIIMPTIQFQMTDEAYQELLSISHQSTGTKALQFVLSEYVDTHKKFYEISKELTSEKRKYNVLESRVTGFLASFEMLKFPT
jgi:hypothetical protein